MSSTRALESYELWWTKNLGNNKYTHCGVLIDAPTVESFKTWMGDSFSADRVEVRKLFGNFNTFLDAGCGACPEYDGLKSMYSNFNYTGLDITPKLVEFNKSQNINCFQGSLNSIPFPDSFFDVVHTRHVVEHMNNIEKPLSELIRVSSSRVFVVFFIRPSDSDNHHIQLDNKGTDGEVYHCVYSKKLIEEQLRKNNKVKNFSWFELQHPSKCVLKIDL